MHVMQEQIDACNASIEPVPYLFDKKWKYSTSLRVDDSGNDSWQVGWPRRFSILILNGVVCDQRAFLPQSWWKVTKGLLYLETLIVATKGLLYLDLDGRCPRGFSTSKPELWRPKGFSTSILMKGDQRASQPRILNYGDQGASLPRS